MNRLGNPATDRPRYVRGPAAHFSFSVCPARPRISMLSSAPVIASKPMANTMLSTAYSWPRVWMPCGVIASIGCVRMSISVMLSRLNVA